MGAFDELQQAIAQTVEQKNGLDAAHAEQRAAIESQYNLAETEQERSGLDAMLERLDRERDQATELLGRGYDEARGQILGRLESATGAGQSELENMASTFERAFLDVTGGEQQAQQNSQLAGIPTGGRPDSGVRDAMGTMFAGFAGAEQSRNAINQEDLSWLADSMLAQRQAAIGDAGRTATRVGGVAQDNHNARVADRINQERMMQADALQRLDGRFDDRRDGLLGQQGQLANQLAMLREQARQADQQAALQREQMAQSAALARRSGGGGGRSSGGGSGGGGSSTPMAAAASGFEDYGDWLARSPEERRRTASRLFAHVGNDQGATRPTTTTTRTRTSPQIAGRQSLGGITR